MKEGNVSDLYSLFSDKNGLTVTVGRGSQVSDRIFKNSKGIKVRDIRSALLVITEENAGKMIRAYFSAKYGPDRSDTQDMEGWWVTQRARL